MTGGKRISAIEVRLPSTREQPGAIEIRRP